jgi:error-prone DNA polymerase
MHVAAKEVGLKLIVGCRLVFPDCPSILVWPTDRAAYGRLCQLLTLGKRRTKKGECDLSLQDLLGYQAGLLAAVIAPDPIPNSFANQLAILKDVLVHCHALILG